MNDNFNVKTFVAQLNDLLKTLPEVTVNNGLSNPALSRLRKDLQSTICRLEKLRIDLDPVDLPNIVLDPSDPQTIGRFIGDTLLAQPKEPLPELSKFYGAGVYALYYNGEFDAYAPIRGTDFPIYVGCADPPHPNADTPQEQGTKLWNRLNDHVRTIKYAKNLRLADFACRRLVVRSAWQRTAEEYLIAGLQPVWNREVKICYGFGKHGDAAATRTNTRSPWDTLHPGRPWATSKNNVPHPKSATEIKEEVLVHLTAIAAKSRISNSDRGK